MIFNLYDPELETPITQEEMRTKAQLKSAARAALANVQALKITPEKPSNLRDWNETKN